MPTTIQYLALSAAAYTDFSLGDKNKTLQYLIDNDRITNGNQPKRPPKRGSKWIRVYLSWLEFYMAGDKGWEYNFSR